MVIHWTIYYGDVLPYNPTALQRLSVFALSALLFSAAILFVYLFREKMGEIRFIYTKWICSIAAVIYALLSGFILDFNMAVPLLTAFFVLFNLSAKESAFSPLVIFGYIGTALAGMISVYIESDSYHLAEPSVIFGTVICIGVILASAYMRRQAFNDNLIRILQTMCISLLFLYGLMFYYYKPLGMQVEELDKLMTVVNPVSIMLLFGLSVLYILEGVKENRLFFINVGFISLCGNLFWLLTGLDVNLLVKGGTLLLMGIALLAINLKITGKKKEGKVSLDEEK